MTVYSIGLGPGDHELLTIKAKRILEESDIVVVPQSDSKGRSVAKEIILNYINKSKIFMYYIPMTNDKEELSRRYQELAEIIRRHCSEGKKVCYVTMGDPTIYSTSNYLTERLKKLNIQVKHIPGISSVNAASTLLGVPLCIKGENFGVYEMPSSTEKAVEFINRHPTTVFMKVDRRLPVLIEAIKKVSPRSAYLAKRLGLEDEEVYDLLNGGAPKEGVYLSIAVIKK